jgi:hypothetical protein
MRLTNGSLRLAVVTILATGTLLGAAATHAASSSNQSAAQKQYTRDRAACMDGRTNQDRATCLREAGAAFAEAKRSGLSNDSAQFERNRLSRCNSHPPADREECIRRMSSEASTSGSVEGGGVLRELRTTVPAAR